MLTEILRTLPLCDEVLFLCPEKSVCISLAIMITLKDLSCISNDFF